MVIIKDSTATRSVILGTNGEHVIKQALIAQINRISNPDDPDQQECQRILDYICGIFKDQESKC